jgi:GntR family transcriptional regulator/MocR family aminotransferase
MARTRTSSAAELLLELRRDDDEPLHRQLERELRKAIRSGRLSDGFVLPSTRGLSDELGISRGVVVEAYEQLVAEGYLSSSQGGTTRVCVKLAEPPVGLPARDRVFDGAGAPIGEPPPIRISFTYGRPDVTEFPRQVWLRSLRRVLNETPSDRLTYLDHRGAPELRDALADYLNRVRGTAAVGDRIVITNGYAQALRLAMMVVRANGGRHVISEDPGQQDTVRAARDHGLRVLRVPVDEAGIVTHELDRVDGGLLVLTPAHHFPTGAVLSAERRAAVVDWAKRRNAIVLEDDYDAEYRYDREPIGAIQGLAPDNVMYAGSASKTLAPGLRLGWLILPARLVDQMADAKDAVDRGSASLEQLAFADFLSHGEFDRHLRRMRPIYRARRDTLLRALREHLPSLQPTGASAGLHVLTWLPDGIDEADLIRRAAEVRVYVDPLSLYWGPAGGPAGLLFGYGTVTEGQIEEGIRLIASVLDDKSLVAGVDRQPSTR